MTVKSALTAEAKLALLREELDTRLTEARAELLRLVPSAADLAEEHRLAKKAAGVRYVQQYHVQPILEFAAPDEVLAYVYEIESDILEGGYEAEFLQGVDLAFGYISGYLR